MYGQLFTYRRAAVYSVLSVMACAAVARGADTNPAPFPNKAAAILVQGSSDDTCFLTDVTSMQTALTAAGNRWQYTSNGAGFVQTLTVGGAGASQTSPANVGTAFSNAGTSLWTTSTANQNLVYYSSSHGGVGTSNKNSTLDMNGTNEAADDFINLVKMMPSGHSQFSDNGSNTTCVRTMTYIIQACNSGGYIYDLTTMLADPATRKHLFPFLSDITVMTAADYNECSHNFTNGNSIFSQELYGYAGTAGILNTNNALNNYAIYQAAAPHEIDNPAATVPAYAVNAAFGAGNNATQYLPGTNYSGGGNNEHPLYRHVSFYPALTLPTSAPIAPGGNNFDMRLNGPQVPTGGPVPVQLALNGASGADSLSVSRQMNTWDTPTTFTPVSYYVFNLLLGSSTISNGSISLTINDPTDPTQIPAGLIPQLHMFEETSPGSGWVDLDAIADVSGPDVISADLTGPTLGEFALGVPVPEPGTLLLLAGVPLLLGRRRRASAASR